jgi:isoleucyl-tRNA synthetase
MSKSLRNYPDVNEVFDRDGADAMRWFLMSSSVIRGGNLVVTEEGIRGGVRELLLPLWSTYYFFTLYATSAGVTARWRTDSENELDRYILTKTREVLEQVTEHLDELDSPFAAQTLRDFGDVLTNWYVRRSRDRFWDGTDQEAFDTLYTVLETLCRMAAPLLPLVAEEIWKGLTGGRSVHLEDWPNAADFPLSPGLRMGMDHARAIASSGLALRKAQKLRVRLPLEKLTVVVANPSHEVFADILADELNVKRVEFQRLGDSSLGDFGIERRLNVNARALGPRLGKDVQRVIGASKAGNWRLDGETVVVDGTALHEGEFELVLATSDPRAAVAFLANGDFIVLDTAVTPELEAEGLARDVIRAVQQARKDADLDVSDRIVLTIVGDDAAVAAIETHRDLIAGEVLATMLATLTGENGATAVGEGSAVTIQLERA